MSEWKFVTDRTLADVDVVEHLQALGWENMTASEREAYSAGLKGAYNAADLNRVGEAVAYIAGRLEQVGYLAPVSPKVDWQISDIPLSNLLENYLSDIRTLRGVLAVLPTTPQVPEDMDKLTYTEANDIEKILADLETLIHNMAAAWHYSGEIYSEEV